jgi:hypothetical protein
VSAVGAEETHRRQEVQRFPTQKKQNANKQKQNTKQKKHNKQKKNWKRKQERAEERERDASIRGGAPYLVEGEDEIYKIWERSATHVRR